MMIRSAVPFLALVSGLEEAFKIVYTFLKNIISVQVTKGPTVPVGETVWRGALNKASLRE